MVLKLGAIYLANCYSFHCWISAFAFRVLDYLNKHFLRFILGTYLCAFSFFSLSLSLFFFLMLSLKDWAGKLLMESWRELLRGSTVGLHLRTVWFGVKMLNPLGLSFFTCKVHILNYLLQVLFNPKVLLLYENIFPFFNPLCSSCVMCFY